jgi:hypothetical protein
VGCLALPAAIPESAPTLHCSCSAGKFTGKSEVSDFAMIARFSPEMNCWIPGEA